MQSQKPISYVSGAPDGCRGDERVLLIAFVTVFVDLRGGVYLMADFFAFFVVLLLFLVLDLTFFHVICSFQDISGWKLRKIVRDLWRAQKGNSYPLFIDSHLFLIKVVETRTHSKKRGVIEKPYE